MANEKTVIADVMMWQYAMGVLDLMNLTVRLVVDQWQSVPPELLPMLDEMCAQRFERLKETVGTPSFKVEFEFDSSASCFNIKEVKA